MQDNGRTSAAGGEREPFISFPLETRVRAFLLLRLLLAAVLLTGFLTTDWSGLAEIGSGQARVIFLLLLAMVCFCALSAVGLRLRVGTNALGTAQVVWDLVFSVAWIFCTGGAESPFLFLYLLVIIEASFLLSLFGILLSAALCSFFYWFELHLEYNQVLSPPSWFLSEGAWGEKHYPVAGLMFFLAATASTAWLSNHLKQRLARTSVLLRERSESIQDLISLNESIVRCVRSGIITIDLAGRITSINEAGSAITGLDPREIVGRKIEEVLGAPPSDALRPEGAGTSHPFRWEQSFSRSEARSLTLGCSSAALRDHTERCFGHLIIFQDLTGFKRIEEELRRTERLAAIGEMAAGLAHEIRNPLASLYGSIQLLHGDAPLDDSQKRLMRIVLQESERLNGLITNFLQFASPHRVPKEPLELRPVVDEVLDLFRAGPQFHDRIEILVEMDPSMRVLGNRKQIHQILWNLLLNAVQATEEGRIFILASERPGAKGKPVVTISVRDTGRGIPTGDMEKIFDPFHTTRPDGTGLGLAVVYRIVEDHEGAIRVESTEGKGTVFHVDLPGVAPDKDELA